MRAACNAARKLFKNGYPAIQVCNGLKSKKRNGIEFQIVKTPPKRGFYVKEVKLTDKPLSFWYSVVDSHSSLYHLPDSKNPAGAGFLRKEVKLTDKPLSFWYSVVDSHSSLFQPPDSKNPAGAGFLH